MFCETALTQGKQAVHMPKCSVTFAAERAGDRLGWALIRRDANNMQASPHLSSLGGLGHKATCVILSCQSDLEALLLWCCYCSSQCVIVHVPPGNEVFGVSE